MNRYIPDEIVDQIKENCNIVDLVNSYVPLKRFGPTWKACCPFHTEKTPSFTVSPDRGMYHCFGCGASGDVFKFVMTKENIDFPMAAHMLAERMGIVIPEQKGTPAQRANRKKVADEKQRVFEIHEKLANWFHTNLINGTNMAVSKYFASRQIPSDFAKRFMIGAALNDWNCAADYLKSQGYTEQEIIASGVITESNKKPGLFYDRFRNRLMFAIWDEQGRVVGFSGRAIEADCKGAKYVNSPETVVFRKSKVLYGLSLARTSIKEKGYAILSEGQIDTIAMHMAGFENTVAPQGTAFTEDQAMMLKRYTDKVYVGFDGDAAGIKAILRAINILLPLEFEVRVIEFPPGSDPDMILKKSGNDAIAWYVNNSTDFFDFVVKKLSDKYDDGSHWWKGRVVTESLQVLLKIENSIIRASCIEYLANHLQIPEEAVREEMNRHIEKSLITAQNNLRHKEFKRNHEIYEAKRRRIPQPYKQNSLQNKAQDGSLYELADYNDTGYDGYGYETIDFDGDPQTFENAIVGVDKAVLAAEETLFELALEDELLGRMIEVELPVEMISKSAVGEALETMIRYTMNDEWELAEDEIRARLETNPSRRVSELLKRPHKFDIEKKKKAVPDCIRTIKIYHLQREVDELSPMIDQDDDILLKYLDKRKELLLLNKERTQL